MGGTKRSISIEKITNKDPRAVAFSKRRHGLYSKSSELCLLSGAQMAILATPVSANSHVSFYSYGHSSVDSVVTAFLKNERPPEDLGFGRWWEDESLATSEDPNDLKSAMDSISSMVKDLKALRLEAVKKQKDHEDLKKEELVSHITHQEETLNLRSSNDEFVDLDEIFDNLTKSEGLFENSEMNNVSVATTSQNPWSDYEAVEDGALVLHKDLDEVNKYFSDFDEDHQIVAMCDNNNNYNDALYGNFDGCNQELDLDLIVDYGKNSEAYVFA